MSGRILVIEADAEAAEGVVAEEVGEEAMTGIVEQTGAVIATAEGLTRMSLVEVSAVAEVLKIALNNVVLVREAMEDLPRLHLPWVDLDPWDPASMVDHRHQFHHQLSPLLHLLLCR